MTSRFRIPSDVKLAAHQIAGMTALEAAVMIAARALVAMYPGMHLVPPGRRELAEIMTARDLVNNCKRLLESLDAHRRHVIVHLPADDPDDDDDPDDERPF